MQCEAFLNLKIINFWDFRVFGWVFFIISLILMNFYLYIKKIGESSFPLENTLEFSGSLIKWTIFWESVFKIIKEFLSFWHWTCLIFPEVCMQSFLSNYTVRKFYFQQNSVFLKNWWNSVISIFVFEKQTSILT